MGKPSAKISVLMSGLMVGQLVFPMVNALAADSSTQPVATSEVSTSPVQPSEPTPETSTNPKTAEPAPATSAPAPATSKPVQTLATTSSTTVPAPTRLVYTAQSPSDIKLEWTGVTGVTTYKIYTIAEDGTRTLVTTATGTNKVINNLPQGRTTFGVTAVSGTEESALSNLLPLNIQYPTLTVPSLSHTFKNGNDVELKWSTVEHASAYEVYEVLADGQQVKLAPARATDTSITLTNRQPGTYKFIVKATHPLYGQSPVGEYSVTVVHPEMATPGSPTHSIISGNDIQLRWSTVDYATGYNVYQIIDGQKVLKATVTTATRTFTNMPAGDYTYEIYSFSDRFGESRTGAAVNLTLTHPTMTAPANLSKTISNVYDARLTWSAVPHATNYNVYEIVNGEKVLRRSVTTTNTSFTALPVGQYNYVVHSVSDRFGESAEGSSITVTIAEEQIDLQAPTNLTHTVLNGNDIQLKWAAGANAQSYKIYQIVDGQKQLKASVTTLNRTFTNMPAGEYTFEVYSYHERVGETPTGATISFAVVHPTVETPANLTQTVLNGNDIRLAWNTVPFATSYKIYQVVNGQKELKATTTTLNRTFTNMPAGDYVYEVAAVSDRFGESTPASITLSLVHPEVSAPTNLTKTILNGNDIKLAWTGVEYANSYKIYQIVNGEKVLKDTVTTLNKTYTNNAAGSYTFEVHAVSTRFGESATGASITFTLGQTDLLPPANVTNSVLNGNDIRLTWPAATNATSYKIYQIIDGQKELKATTTTLNRTFTNMPAGDYTFEVYSISDRFGESESGAQTSLTLVHPVMETPGNLTQSIANGNDIQLRWNTVPHATSYKVYQIIDGQKELKATVNTGSKTFTNMPAGDYTYEVYSVSDRFGESAAGAETSLTLTHPTMISPAAGTPAVSVLNGNDIQLKWTAVTYATSYKVYQLVDGQKVLKDTLPAVTKTYTNMPAGNYTYVIHSYSDRFGESAEGVTISQNLVHPTMQAPANFVSSIKNGNDIELKWAAATYATEYRVYQITNGQRSLLWKGTGLTRTLTNMPEGDYSFEITSFSTRFGESVASKVEQNVTHPTMTAPTLTTQITSMSPVTVRLNWTAIPFATKYYVYRIIDNQAVLMRSVTTTTTTFNYLAPDRYEFVVTSYSDRFGESIISLPAPVDLYFDTVAPQTTANAPTGWNKPGTIVPLTATDNSSGVSKTFYSINNGPFVEGTSIALTTHGDNTIKYYSVDNAGNTETAKVATVQIDATTPTTTVSGLPTDWSTEPVTLSLEASDSGSGVNKTFYSINGAPFVEGTSIALNTVGTHTVEYYSVDKVGNTEAKKSVQVKVDNVAPITTSDVTADMWNKDATTITLSATDNFSGVAKTFYSVNGGEFIEGTSILVERAGINTVSFYSVDVAGNREATQTVQVKIDGNAPVTTSDIKDAWNNAGVTVALTATDAETEVAGTYYSINGGEFAEGTSFTVDQEGIHTVSFYSVDAAGNKEAVQTQEVKIDTTAPATTTDVLPTWYDAAVTVALNATDNLSGVAKTFYSVNGGEFIEGTSALVKRAGINTVSFYSVDAAGNREATQTVEVKIDGNAPVTTSDATDVWNTEAVTVNLTATDAETEVAKTFYSINGGAYVEGTSFLVDQEGINTISFYSVDVAGNKEAAKTAEVKIDTTAPVSTSNAPTTWSKTNVEIKLAATDNVSGVAKTFYSINGGAFVEGTALVVEKEGINKVSFYSVDVAGNKEATQTVEVKIDKTAPLLSINLGSELPLGSLQLNYLLKEELSGVSTELMVVTGPGMSAGGNKVKNGETINVTQAGQYSVTITATDAAGNTTTITRNFAVYIPATIEVTPKVIKGNKGVFTVRVDLPQGLSTNGFDLNTATINGVKALSSNNGYYNQAKNGQFKFERSDFTWNTPEVVLEFRGYVNGQLVKGQTTVKVNN